jgi:precorrin-8X/cobalt-precorrin-8 methylmutase
MTFEDCTKMRPEEIEILSFEIIDSEAGEHDFSAEQWPIVRRMIHTSADFEYMKTVRFHHKAISAGIGAIRSGKPIITDTQMALAGIRKSEAKKFGINLHCLIGNPAIIEQAAASGTTRAHAAADASIPLMNGGICVVGNAPTALLRLIELVKAKKASPALIIGLPVGFVNAAESKAALVKTDYPHISNVGRKGGSNVAASVVNALLIMAANQTF